MKENKTLAGNYLTLASLAFAGLGLEVILALVIEPILYGSSIGNWTVIQNILHWSFTCILWLLIAAALIHTARKKYEFDIFQPTERIKTWQWLAIVACIVFSLIVSYIDWNGSKVVKEYLYHGLPKFIFQYLYYLVETILVSLIIIFAQKACECRFLNPNIPYGGMITALTWGLVHILTKGSIITGIICALGGFLFGLVYLLTNRNIRIAFPILFIMFVL